MSKILAGLFTVAFTAVLAMSSAAYAGDAAAGQALFDGKGKCKTCHKITDAAAVGPGLAAVSTRHSDEWLTAWLLDPQGVWEAEPQDKETTQLKTWKPGKDTKKKTSMRIPTLEDAEVADLLAYLKTL
jgi:cytochrome c2